MDNNSLRNDVDKQLNTQNNVDGNTVEEAKDVNNIQIPEKLILKLSVTAHLNKNVKYEQKSILQVDDCKNVGDARKVIQNIDFKKIPNIFIVVFNLNDDEEFENLLHEKIFPKNRLFLIELCFKNELKFYLKKSKENFIKINLSLSQNELIDHARQSTFTITSFLNILMLQNSSHIDANLTKINSFLSLDQKSLKLFHFAIIQQDPIFLRLLNLFSVNLSTDSYSEFIYSSIRTGNFDIFLPFLNASSPDQIKKEEISKILNLKSKENSKNPFFYAVECRNVKVVKLFLKFAGDFKTFFNFNQWKSAWYIAIDRENFDVCEALKSFDVNFTELEKSLKRKLIENYANMLEDISKLHQSITNGSLEEVKKFTEKNQELKLCYGKLKVCALEWSIECQKFSIYAFLRSKGFYTDASDQLWAKIQALSYFGKRQIRSENLKYIVSDPDAFIGILLTKCSFDSGSTLHFDEIRQMLVDLAKIREFRPVMEIVALSKVKIIFDFKSESVKTMDPTRNEYTMGIAYFTQNILYVGKNANKNQLYGTVAHEMTHLALYLVYENECLPYCKNDTERESKWIQIVERVKQTYENNPERTDNIIKWVFQCYDAGYEQRAELIVRVNDLLGYYFDNPEKIKELRTTFANIFEFYNDFTIFDLDPENFQLKNLNTNFGTSQELETFPIQFRDYKRFLVKSDVPKLSLLKLQRELIKLSKNLLAYKCENIFVDLKKFLNLKDDSEKLLNSKKIKRIIIDASASTDDDSNKIITKLRVDVEYFVVVLKNDQNINLPGFHILSECFEFLEFDTKSRKVLLDKQIIFQNLPFKLSQLLSESEINSDVVAELCCSESIFVNSIGSTDPLSSDAIFISRKFEYDLIVKSLDDLINSFIEQKVILIADVAGSGKTFIADKIRREMIKKFPNYFTVYANFRDFSRNLLNSPLKDFPTFICENVLNSSSHLDKAIFYNCYSKNRVIVLLDGFDEVSQRCREKAIELMKLHRCGNLLLTTRDYIEENLETALGVNSHKLIPYTSIDQKSFAIHSG